MKPKVIHMTAAANRARAAAPESVGQGSNMPGTSFFHEYEHCLKNSSS